MYTDLLGMLTIVVSYFVYFVACGKFFEKFFHSSTKRGLLFVWVSFGISVLLLLALITVALPPILYSALDLLFFICAVMVIYNAPKSKKLFGAILMAGLRIMVFNLCLCLFACAGLLFYNYGGVQNYAVSNVEGYYIVFLSISAVSVLIYILSKRFCAQLSEKTNSWYLTAAVPLFAYWCILQLALWGAKNGIMFASGGLMGFYYNLSAKYTAIAVLSAICLTAVWSYIYGMVKTSEEQEKAAGYKACARAFSPINDEYKNGVAKAQYEKPSGSSCRAVSRKRFEYNRRLFKQYSGCDGATGKHSGIRLLNIEE